MSNINNWSVSFAKNTVAYGTGTQGEYFAAIGAKATAGKWFTTHEGVWVSAGAGYGPQVEFSSEALRDAFIKANDGAFASTGCGTHARVNVNSVPMFAAAFKAAKGEVAETPVVSAASLDQAQIDKAQLLLRLVEKGFTRDEIMALIKA